MTYTCENPDCKEKFEDNTNGEIEEIDSDKYSTMYRETKVITCPHCNYEREIEKEYWENDETGDITE